MGKPKRLNFLGIGVHYAIVFGREKWCPKPATYNHWEYALAKKLLDKSLARDQSGKHSSAFSHDGRVSSCEI